MPDPINPDETTSERALRRAKRGDPQEVEGVEGGEPVVVEMKEPPKPEPIKNTQGKLHLPPTTTEQENIVVAGQRRINMIWESVQGVISVGITGAVVYCQINGIQSETLNNAFFFVVAMYLQRSNHTRIGGVGDKPNPGPYTGR